MNKRINKELIVLLKTDQKLRSDLKSHKVSYRKFCALNKKLFKKFEALITENGWQMIEKLHGQQLLAAFVLAQHTESIAFQKEFLKALKKLPQRKATKKFIAYLQDRILVRESRPQIYGTQLTKDKKGNLKLARTKSKKNLDRLRKKMGLESIEKYFRKIKAHH